MLVLGYSKFVSSKGNNCCFLFVTYPPAPSERSVVGIKAEQVFIPEDVAVKVVPDLINKEIVISYRLVAGKPQVADFHVVD